MIQFCKVLAVIAYVLGFIVGITSCRATMYDTGNFLPGMFAALFCWLVALVSGSVFVVLAHVLGRLDDLESANRDNQYAVEGLNDQLKAVQRSVNGKPEAAQPPPVAKRIAQRPDTWTCKKCHAVNQRTDLACRDCGAYR